MYLRKLFKNSINYYIMSKEKISGKTALIIGTISVLLGITMLYLIYEIWTIFGFWRLTITGLINFLASVILFQLVGSGKSEKEDVLIYNPKEWPKLLGIVVFLVVAFYLHNHINQKENLTSLEYYYGIGYLSLLSILPTLYTLFKLVRDRNDFVKIKNGILYYKDNSTEKQFEISTIKSCSNNIKIGLTLTFKDENTHLIPLKNMNFNSRDSINLTSDIDKLIIVDEPDEVIEKKS